MSVKDLRNRGGQEKEDKEKREGDFVKAVNVVGAFRGPPRLTCNLRCFELLLKASIVRLWPLAAPLEA